MITAEKTIEMPEKWRTIFAEFPKLYKRNIFQLREISIELLNETDDITNAERDLLEQTIEIIEKWREKDIEFKAEKEHFRRKFLGRRKLLYRQTVKWLTTNYSQIIWKENLNLGEIAVRSKKKSVLTAAALKNSNKFRHWTGLHQFRLFINEQSSKMPNWLRAGTSAHISPICGICGAEDVSDPAKRTFICQNGHKKDRDEKAAENLLKQSADKIYINDYSVNIPHHLQHNIVRID